MQLHCKWCYNQENNTTLVIPSTVTYIGKNIFVKREYSMMNIMMRCLILDQDRIS